MSIETILACNLNSKKTHIQLLCNFPLGITTIMQLSPLKYGVLLLKIQYINK